MKYTYLLSATGPDRPGIVARVSQILFRHGCNLEDSSMMKLGSEFGIFLILTSNAPLHSDMFRSLEGTHQLTLTLKKISRKLALSRPIKNKLGLVTVHGFDRPGIVYHVTDLLAHMKFNISDLATHRTVTKNQAGYILFIEGEIPSSLSISLLEKKLTILAKKLKIHITIRPLHVNPL